MELRRLGILRVVLRPFKFFRRITPATYRHGGGRAPLSYHQRESSDDNHIFAGTSRVDFFSPSLEAALGFIAHMLTHDWLVYPDYKKGLVYIGILVVVEWLQRSKDMGSR